MVVRVTDTHKVYLAPAEYVDSDHPLVLQTAARLAGAVRDPATVVRRLFYHVRDLSYGAPDFDRLDSFKASTVLAEGRGYCVAKASAFAALARAAGIPARLAFADVTNHLATARTLELMEGAVFAWHGYAEALVDGFWLKVSPTFDAPLCKRMNVLPLEFDGRSDAYLQPYDGIGQMFMSYDKLHGRFHDVPARFLAAEMVRMYPRAYAAIRAGSL
ncbi:transglutaminase-like domain-containing protein [Bradyrhizobium sp. LHD-71]|uniref:transglutaminase-like domain-containing protein n=1 Tax=Bradyrhizobium sp. LHD-71 TaxID=3072141 RepID=UPI00280D7FE7|nr:transglutaminase-like domain-containing protein [Bradyrhizobium sp. LHD-71]MDQ8729267.1 transglutaminase-like domain-containing protein [Bradyrhizobium sp. LHD-71]